MTSHHDVAVVVAELRIGFDVSPAIAERAAALLESQAKALSEAEAKRERMWCTACGTVTRDGVCDCNQYQAGHKMCREPSFVNYADECSKDAREQFSRANAAEARLTEAMKVIEPFAKAAIAYDPDEGEPNSIADKEAVWGDDDLEVGHLRAARAFKEKT